MSCEKNGRARREPESAAVTSVRQPSLHCFFGQASASNLSSSKTINMTKDNGNVSIAHLSSVLPRANMFLIFVVFVKPSEFFLVSSLSLRTTFEFLKVRFWLPEEEDAFQHHIGNLLDQLQGVDHSGAAKCERLFVVKGEPDLGVGDKTEGQVCIQSPEYSAQKRATDSLKGLIVQESIRSLKRSAETAVPEQGSLKVARLDVVVKNVSDHPILVLEIPQRKPMPTAVQKGCQTSWGPSVCNANMLE